jgi:hypothetical protein
MSQRSSRSKAIACLATGPLIRMGQRNPAPVDMFYPIIYRVSTIQGGAGFRNHPQYHLLVKMAHTPK